MIKPTDKILVIVCERPQRVWVYIIDKDEMHCGKWRTVNSGEMGVQPDAGSSKLLLNAAMMRWNGEDHFTCTADELDKSSGGYGIQ